MSKTLSIQPSSVPSLSLTVLVMFCRWWLPLNSCCFHVCEIIWILKCVRPAALTNQATVLTEMSFCLSQCELSCFSQGCSSAVSERAEGCQMRNYVTKLCACHCDWRMGQHILVASISVHLSLDTLLALFPLFTLCTYRCPRLRRVLADVSDREWCTDQKHCAANHCTNFSFSIGLYKFSLLSSEQNEISLSFQHSRQYLIYDQHLCGAPAQLIVQRLAD